MKPICSILFALAVPLFTQAFITITTTTTTTTNRRITAGTPCAAVAGTQLFFSSWGDQEEHQNYQDEGEPSLVLGGEEMQKQMQQLKSKYPTSEADYLAAARERAKNKPSSQQIRATVEDFQKVAEEKRKVYGEFDDWEESAKEAGNLDSQILLPQLPEENENDDGEGPEPTLLL